MIRYVNSIKLAIDASILTILIPILFFGVLFIGSKFYKKGEWNDEYLSLKQTKIIRGFLAIGILLHHCAQRTSASWLPSKYIIHGLDFFVDIGYLFVGVFLFISGYGLYKSLKKKDDYFEHYFSRRILPILIAYFTTSLTFYFYNTAKSTYTWYIVAILVCYVLFYFAFKYIRKEYMSFLIVLVGIILYCAICNFFILGGWWYNTIGLFIIGLLFGKFEGRIIGFIKKVYIPLFIATIIGVLVFRYYGRFYEDVIYSVTKESVYDSYSLLIIVFRFLAATCFTLLILLISLKCKFNSRVLSFYGNMSLEFYLIQGMFVHMFSYSYFDVSKPLYYIKNIPLYILVVLLLATSFGFFLHYVDTKLHEFLIYFEEKRHLEINYVKRALIVVLLVIIVVFVAYLAFVGLVEYQEDKGYKEAIETYKEKYISFADVDNKKMAAYIVGQGKDTLVLMRGNDDPCPSLSMRFLADTLAEKYRVVVLDYLGTGFSDKPTSPRTSKNIAYEIHEALHDFDITDNYILVPQYISGIYAQEYVKKYKDEVKGVIAIESEVLPERKALTNSYGISQVEYHKHLKLDCTLKNLLGNIRYIPGVESLVWKVYYDYYWRGLNEDELVVARKLLCKNIYNSTYLDEHKYEYQNLTNSLSAQYPRNIFVYDILSHYDAMEIARTGKSSDDLHAQVCFNRSKHKSKEVSDIYKGFFVGPGIILKLVDEAVGLIK